MKIFYWCAEVVVCLVVAAGLVAFVALAAWLSVGYAP